METFLNGRIATFAGCYFRAVMCSGLPPTRTKKIPDFPLTVKQFALTMQNDYYGHESTN